MRPGAGAVVLVGVGLLAGCGSSAAPGEPASTPSGSAALFDLAAPSDSAAGTMTTPAFAAPAPECGGHDVGPATVRTHCGTATAAVEVNGTRLDFPTGACELGPNFVSLVAGTVVTGSGPVVVAEKAKYTSLTLAVGPSAGNEESVEAARDGTYTQGLITVNNHGSEAGSGGAASHTITLADGRRTGRFQINSKGGGSVTGSWSCAPPGSPVPTVAGP